MILVESIGLVKTLTKGVLLDVPLVVFAPPHLDENQSEMLILHVTHCLCIGYSLNRKLWPAYISWIKQKKQWWYNPIGYKNIWISLLIFSNSRNVPIHCTFQMNKQVRKLDSNIAPFQAEMQNKANSATKNIEERLKTGVYRCLSKYCIIIVFCNFIMCVFFGTLKD